MPFFEKEAVSLLKWQNQSQEKELLLVDVKLRMQGLTCRLALNIQRDLEKLNLTKSC